MASCDEYSLKALQYLDGRLQGQELDDFYAHLEACPNCRASLETERALTQLLYRSRPLHSAPPALRARVSAAVEQYAAPLGAREGFYEQLWRSVGSGFADPARRVGRLRLLAATLAVTALVLAFVPDAVRQVRAANYVKTAVVAHRSYGEGNLALGIRSDSPEQVTAWFAGKVPFQFRLPNAQSVAGSTPTYHLTGASLVSYRGSPAALVTYEKQKEKISLLVASSQSAQVAGGEEVRYGALTFHYRTDQGLNVVTWSNHGLSYALVSSVSGSARQSCMVCHQSMADSQNFRSGH
ncbi:MAG TPA: zf-HC2 domain-containing protein [Candidatus Sulfotelmatobacter sp.]|nr:zf-HC2 domain-containing protein [Candidatus Sulfotelmatobacter sp.]